MRPFLLFLAGILCFASTFGQQQGVRVSGDVLVVGLAAGAFTTTLLKKDYTGTKQLVFSGLATVGSTYLLKATVRKERPDGSNRFSFPSAHTAVAFSASTFLQRRYGWKLGVPAYLLSSYVGWSRIYARKHDIWDVSAGALLGTASSLLLTRPFAQKHQLVIAPSLHNGSTGLYASFVF